MAGEGSLTAVRLQHRFAVGSVVRSVALSVPLLAGCAVSATRRAESLVRQHREADAVVVLEARLSAHPDDSGARKLLVRVLGLLGDVGAARDEATELSRRLPGDVAPYLELGHALELAHRFDEALEAYDRAAEALPSSPEGPREGGMRCAAWGELGDARARLEEALRRGAKDGETWHVLGLVKLQLGDLDGARDAYRAGTAADPGAPENWLGLATVAVAREDARSALEAYDAVAARAPAFAAAQLGRAWALARLGRVAEASRALDRAERLGAPRENVARQRAALGDSGLGQVQAPGNAGN
jgi:tetratricopeptide (TPR) repeat protein